METCGVYSDLENLCLDNGKNVLQKKKPMCNDTRGNLADVTEISKKDLHPKPRIYYYENT